MTSRTCECAAYLEYLTGLSRLTALALRVRFRQVLVDRRIVTHAGDETIVSNDDLSVGRCMGLSQRDAVAAKLLSDLFCVLVGLQSLSIDWEGISDDNCVDLARGLKALTGLQALEISPVDQHGAQVLFDALQNAPLMHGVHMIYYE
jgi:hypothetical protein